MDGAGQVLIFTAEISHSIPANEKPTGTEKVLRGYSLYYYLDLYQLHL
jgi:hypothetical protein